MTDASPTRSRRLFSSRLSGPTGFFETEENHGREDRIDPGVLLPIELLVLAIETRREVDAGGFPGNVLREQAELRTVERSTSTVIATTKTSPIVLP